jgi:nucleotide-binding universal stress UspA family protein
MIKRVLFAVDDSADSLRAARFGAPLTAGWKAAIRILTAVPAQADEARRAQAQSLLDHIARELSATGIAADRIDAVLRSGEAFRCILDEARAWQADMIVMGLSRRDQLRSPYVGSQTEHVLEFSACPVLVV